MLSLKVVTIIDLTQSNNLGLGCRTSPEEGTDHRAGNTAETTDCMSPDLCQRALTRPNLGCVDVVPFRSNKITGCYRSGIRSVKVAERRRLIYESD